MSPQASWCGPRAMRGPDRRGGRTVCRAWPSPLPGTWPRICPARWATPGRGKRRVSGAPHRVDAYLLELGAGIILLAIVNVMFLPHDIGFLGWQPNPALALVAVIAARHGLREGIMAALVMAGLELACRLSPPEDTSWSMMRSLQTYVTPLLSPSTALSPSPSPDSRPPCTT